MVKKIIAVATAFLMLCCMIPFGAFADVLDACPKCGERTYVQETGLTVDACGIGVTYNTKHCTSCRYSYYEWSLFGRTGYKEFESGVGDNLVADFISEWIIDNFGKDVRFTKFESGGGSTDGSGVGRRPDGYADDNGTANIGSDGEFQIAVYPLIRDNNDNYIYPAYFVTGSSDVYKNYYMFVRVSGLNCTVDSNITDDCHISTDIYYIYKFSAPVKGFYYIKGKQKYVTDYVFNANDTRVYTYINKLALNSNYGAGQTVSILYDKKFPFLHL